MVQNALVKHLGLILHKVSVLRRSIDELLLEKQVLEVVDLIVLPGLSAHEVQVKGYGCDQPKHIEEPLG